MSIYFMKRHIRKMLKSFYEKGKLEVGIDEAGRGPLFGRVYIGAVILPQDDSFDHSLMRDSKKLNEKNRLDAYEYIVNNAIDWTSYWVTEKEVDKMNVFQATHYGMHKALDNLIIKPEHILVDGNKFYEYERDGKVIPNQCIVGGDDKYSSIAAASIIAKVERDLYIKDVCEEYPYLNDFYELEKNKGYGTKKHIDGIRKHGISEWHRKTFGICKKFA
jgi:ribonuclease HII